MLHPSLLYKSSSPECQFSLSFSSQTKIKIHRLALLPLHFTLSVFSSLAAAGCGRRLSSEACQGSAHARTQAQSGAKKRKKKQKQKQPKPRHLLSPVSKTKAKPRCQACCQHRGTEGTKASA